MKKDKYIIGVYGTLKKDRSNHRFLKNSKFLGTLCSKELFTMYDMGGFPALTEGNTSIHFEIYKVDYETLRKIYNLEGYSGIRDSIRNWYDTMDIQTQWGKAEMFYLKTKPVNCPIIENGYW